MVGRRIFAVVVGVAACSSTSSRVVESPDASGGASAGGSDGSAGANSGGNANGGMAGESNSAGGAGEGGLAGTSGNGGTAGEGGGAGEGGEPNDPIPTNGLLLWFDAERGVQAEGDDVASWLNQAGNGPDATQLSSSSRPMLVDWVGKPALEFDGVDDRLELPSGFDDFVAGLSAFAVVQPAAYACMPVFQFSNGSELDDISLQADLDLDFEYEVNTDIAESTAGALQIGVTSLVSAIHQPPAAATVRVDGNAVGANASMALPQKVTRLLNAIGNGHYVDCQSWSGLMFEIVLYDRPLSDAEVAQVEGYLLQKWAP